jgi:hypothetical protein
MPVNTAYGTNLAVGYVTVTAANPGAINVPSGCIGLYSLYNINNAYSGPVANLRINIASTDYFSDFYSVSGLLITAGGTSLSTWQSSASVIYVTTLYDQSGSGNHATQSSTGNQPVVNLSFPTRVTFGTGTGFMNITNSPMPSGNTSYTYTVKHGAVSSTHSFWFGGTVVAKGVNALCIQSGYYNNYWWGNDVTFGTGYLAAGNVVTCKYDGANRTEYVNGVVRGGPTSAGVPRNSTAGSNNMIGKDPQNNWFMNTDLYYLSIFSAALSDANQAVVEGAASGYW